MRELNIDETKYISGGISGSHAPLLPVVGACVLGTLGAIVILLIGTTVIYHALQ